MTLKVKYIWEKSYLREKKKTLLLLVYGLKFGKSSLFCCNGYSHAISTILFYESRVKFKKSVYKRKKRIRVNERNIS